MPLPQGDLKLLESDIAKRLLISTIPARFAYTSRDGTRGALEALPGLARRAVNPEGEGAPSGKGAPSDRPN